MSAPDLAGISQREDRMMDSMTRLREPRAAGRRRAAPLLLVALLVLPNALRADETLQYRWKIEGFFGALAGLFFPRSGEGSLIETTTAEGHLKSALRITSQAEDDASFFLYEAEIDPANGRTIAARSSQLWQGKRKDKSGKIVDAGAVDVASAIHLLRKTLPEKSRELEIWSDGKLYPVLVTPVGPATRKIGGRAVSTLHYAIRPLVRPERRVWKGELDLWFARDPQSTPVEILVARSPARVRLELVQQP